jgi:glycosyltransferase involved in cell wall biosynthesis
MLLDNLKALVPDVSCGSMCRYFSFLDVSLLFTVIKNTGVNIIHLHWLHPFLLADTRLKTLVKSILFIIQLFIIKCFGIKVVWTVHNLKNHENRYQKLEGFFSRIIARDADAIIAHCEIARQDIQRVFKVRKHGKIAVIPHGSYRNAYKNTITAEEARHRLKLLPTDVTFLCLGLIRPYKGVLELIESFQKLDSSDARLIIAGRPQNRNLVNLLIQKSEGKSTIRLIPEFIPDDEIQVYMNAADVVILPYRDVLNSGAVILAMSFGKAVIAPRLGCIPEILDSSGSFLYNPDGQDSLVQAMKQAIAARAKLREMGEHNYELDKKLDWQHIAVSTFQVYKECMGREKGKDGRME